MQGRVEQPDADRQTVHQPEKMCEIFDLQRHQPFQRGRAPLGVFGKDHLAHQRQTVFLEEHMLGPAKPDTLGLKRPCHLGFGIGVGIRAHFDVTLVVRPGQERVEGVVQFGLHQGHLTRQKDTRRAIQRDHLAFLEDAAIRSRHGLLPSVQGDLRGPNDTRQAQSPRHHGRMAGHPAPLGQDALGGMHAPDVFGRGFASHQDHRLAPRRRRLCSRRGKHQLTRRRAGACRHA